MMARNTKERLQQMAASEKKNRENIRAFVESAAPACVRRSYAARYPAEPGTASRRQGGSLHNASAFTDDRDWMLAHYEQRLAELMAKGAHITHPWITNRYEADILSMSKHAGRRESE